jgi:hypothetical protein
MDFVQDMPIGVVHVRYVLDKNPKTGLDLWLGHSSSLSATTNKEQAMNEEVYNLGHVQELMADQLGVKRSTFYYHASKMPPADRIYGGWPFYTSAQIDLVKAYFMRLSSTKRYLRQKAAEMVVA